MIQPLFTENWSRRNRNASVLSQQVTIDAEFRARRIRSFRDSQPRLLDARRESLES